MLLLNCFMLLYFFSYISCFILGICKQRRNPYIECVLLFAIGVFLCTSYFCGSDWRSYELMYDDIDCDNLFFNYFAEPGFYLYMVAFKLVNVNFWHFFIFTKFLCFVLCVSVIKQYLKEDFWISLGYFLPWFGFYLFIDCPLRNLIAVSIFIHAIYYFTNRNYFTFFFLVIIAILFHFSALLFVPFVFLLKRKIRSGYYIIIFVLVNVLFTSRDFVVFLVQVLFGNIPYFNVKIESYLLNENEFAVGRVFSVGMLVQFVFFAMFIIYRKYVERSVNGIIIFNFVMLYLILYRVATTIEVFSRIQLYTSVFFCISLFLLSRVFAKKSRIIYFLYLFWVASIGTIKLFESNKYIPYSSYLQYVFKKKPSFEYRDSYNYKNSPYTP